MKQSSGGEKVKMCFVSGEVARSFHFVLHKRKRVCVYRAQPPERWREEACVGIQSYESHQPVYYRRRGGCGVWGVRVREVLKIKRLPAKTQKSGNHFQAARRTAAGKKARELWSDVANCER